MDATLAPMQAEPSLIVGPGMARALLCGRKTEQRVLVTCPLARCRPGDRIWVREACIATRDEAGQEFATSRHKAEFVVFTDGWRHYRDGHDHIGPPLPNRERRWIASVHMPRWASRITLAVDAVRRERLQAITDRAIRAEGAVPVLGGLLWGWPRPIPGLHLRARHAFAKQWNLTHCGPGERWEDDPAVAVLRFHVERGHCD